MLATQGDFSLNIFIPSLILAYLKHQFNCFELKISESTEPEKEQGTSCCNVQVSKPPVSCSHRTDWPPTVPCNQVCECF